MADDEGLEEFGRFYNHFASGDYDTPMFDLFMKVGSLKLYTPFEVGKNLETMRGLFKFSDIIHRMVSERESISGVFASLFPLGSGSRSCVFPGNSYCERVREVLIATQPFFLRETDLGRFMPKLNPDQEKVLGNIELAQRQFSRGFKGLGNKSRAFRNACYVLQGRAKSLDYFISDVRDVQEILGRITGGQPPIGYSKDDFNLPVYVGADGGESDMPVAV